MANGGLLNFIVRLGNLPVPNAGSDNNSPEGNSLNSDLEPKNLKLNAASLFDKRWNDAQAAQRRNNLTAQLPNSESFTLKTRDSGFFQRTEQPNTLLSQGTDQANTFLFQQTEQAKTLLKQSWQDLVNLASQHQDLESFHHESPEFWDSVAHLSDLQIVETYVNGQLEPRVSSRYGELLESLNRQGGAAALETFLSYLPAGEKEVFLARYQIEQTFGATELYAGRGIATDVKGQFPLQVFLSENGKNPQVSVNTLLGLYGGDAAAAGKVVALLEQPDFVANLQFLLSAKSAALLGLSLALYQNINAFLSINDLTPEAFLPKTPLEAVPLPNQLSSKENFGKPETSSRGAAASEKQVGSESIMVSALINGALKTAEKYRKYSFEKSKTPQPIDDDPFSFSFAAGATGAMMGATIGCIVPLAEKSVAETLSFATSVVVGLTDSGLRSLGANTIVALITSGVQSFLDAATGDQQILSNASPNRFLNQAEPFEIDLRKSFSNRPLIVSG